jgi:hypothetical protein
MYPTGVKHRNENLDVYQKMTTEDSLTVSVYGDDAYAMDAAKSSCKLGTTAKTDFSGSRCIVSP